MPDPRGIVSLAVDFDGTLAHGYDEGRELAWRPGALALLQSARSAGVRVVVHSCRATTHPHDFPIDEEAFWLTGQVSEHAREGWRLRGEMLAFLEREGVLPLVEIWEGPGKPIADHYVDDKAEGPDLITLAAALGVVLTSGHGPQGAQSVGSGI